MSRWCWPLALGLSLHGTLLLAPGIQAGVPSFTPLLMNLNEPSYLRDEAVRAEREERWDDALDLYLRLYNSANPPADIRDRIRGCMQNALRFRRHRDPAFQQYVLALKPAQALDLYSEVIDRLSTLYPDRRRCTPARLFAYGLRELDQALADPTFRHRHLDDASETQVERFRESLRESWAQRLPITIREARPAAFELLRDARDQLGTRNGSAVVLELLCGACTGLDEFTVYVAPTGEQADLATPIAELAEYGLLVRPVASGIVVDGVIAGSWADQHTRIRRGDRIARVNGRPLDQTDPASLKLALQGAGMYGHELELFPIEGPVSVVRLPVPLPSVYGAEILNLREGIAYLRLAAIRDTTPQELADSVLSLKARGARVLILDVRGNVGGNFLAGIQVAQQFLPAGIIVTTQGQSAEFSNRVFSSDSGMTAFDLPVVLLVDARTMSAAEAIAAAWKDNGRATLVGLPTFGKGTIQGQIRLTAPDGAGGSRSGELILTVAHMTGPRGLAVGARVVPHVIEADAGRQLDLAVTKAIELANGMR